MTSATSTVKPSVTVSDAILRLVAASARLSVAVAPGTGLNLSSDWWDAGVDELGISHCDYGIDAAVSGLVMRLSNALDDGEFDDCNPQNATLVLKLHLARLDGTLWRLLQDSTVFAGDRDFEIVT